MLASGTCSNHIVLHIEVGVDATEKDMFNVKIQELVPTIFLVWLDLLRVDVDGIEKDMHHYVQETHVDLSTALAPLARHVASLNVQATQPAVAKQKAQHSEGECTFLLFRSSWAWIPVFGNRNVHAGEPLPASPLIAPPTASTRRDAHGRNI